MAIVLPKPRRIERDYSEDVINTSFINYLTSEYLNPESNISTSDINDTIQVYLSGGKYTNLPEKLQQQYKSYDLGRPIEKQKKESPKFTMDTPQYGELTITGVGEFNPTLNRLSLETDKGNFHFYTQDVLDKGYIVTEGAGGKEIAPKQVYYDLLINDDLRTEYDEKSFQVDLSSIPSTFNERNKLGISGSRGDFSDFEAKQGVLIPEELHNKVSAESYTITDEKGAITGLTNTTNHPYIKENFVYAREGNDQAPEGSIDLKYINADNEFAISYSWEDDSFFGGVVGEISDALAGIEDVVREGSDQLRSALQNEYVRGAIKVIASVSPDPFTRAGAAALDLGLTYDDGDKPSASQVVNVVLSGADALKASGGAGGTMSVEGGPPQTGGATETSAFDNVIQTATDETVQKVVTAAGKIIDDEDVVNVLVDSFGQEIINGVADATDATLGTEAGDVIRDNPKASNVILDVGTGKDVSETIVDTYADEIADATGATTTNEIAGVKAALDFGVAKDQSETTTDALLSATETYFDEGGTVDLGIDPNLTGDLDLAFGDTGIDLDPLDLAQTASEALAAGEDAIRDAGSALDDYVSEVIPGEDITQQLSENLAELTDEASDALAQLEDDVSEAIPGEDITQEISEGAAKFEDNVVDALADVDDTVSELIDDQDIPQNIAESAAKLEDNVIDALADVDDYISDNLPEFDMPEGPDLPEVSMPTLDLMQFAGLLGGLSTGGGTAPAQEEQAGSQYQTKFNFLAGLEPLGMLGSFQKRA